jgi:c-di-GMP-binding flagellar brake protein YcgR
MLGLQELDIRQIKEVISEAADRRVPVAMTLRDADRWIQLHSRIIAAGQERVLLEIPTDGNGTPHEFSPADRIGVAFKLKHHKYICMVTVAGLQTLALDDESSIQVLAICWPNQMQRIQRRAFFRARVPRNSLVRASFWLGGQEAEPDGTTLERPVFTGCVTNISVGGFELRTTDNLPSIIEGGYLVGVRISFGPGGEGLFADARIRHIAPEDDQFVVGLQFIGLEQTAKGKDALRLIGAKVTEFQRLGLHEMTSSGPRT